MAELIYKIDNLIHATVISKTILAAPAGERQK
jgi:hypothetical protein